MNKVLLVGRLTRDPEMRIVADGKTVTQFSLRTENDDEYHTIVVWHRLAEVTAQYLGKGQLVGVEGKIKTRQWEDDRKVRRWKTEIVATNISLYAGRRMAEANEQFEAEQEATNV